MGVIRPTRGCRYYARRDLPERGITAEQEIDLDREVISEAHAFQFWQAGVFGVIDERAPQAHLTTQAPQSEDMRTPLTRDTLEKISGDGNWDEVPPTAPGLRKFQRKRGR